MGTILGFVVYKTIIVIGEIEENEEEELTLKRN